MSSRATRSRDEASSNLVHVAYAAVLELIKHHAVFQSAHGDSCFALAAVGHVYVQADGAAVGARVLVRHASEIASNQGKEVCGYAVGAMEHAVPVAVHDIAFKQVAVGKHDRELLRVANEGRCETGHHVRAIDEVGDIAEPLSLALRDERAVGAARCEHMRRRQRARQRTCRGP